MDEVNTFTMSILPLELSAVIVDFEIAMIAGVVAGKLFKAYMSKRK